MSETLSAGPPEDRAEQATPAVPGGTADVPDVPLEADAFDTAEQAAAAAPAAGGGASSLPLEADPFDAAEQGADVPLDEDDRR